MSFTTLKKIGMIVGIMMCLITMVSVRNYSRIPLGVGPVHYVAGFTMIAIAIFYLFRDKIFHTSHYIFLILYLIWAAIGIYRGQFEITSAFLYNQYLHGILFVLSPIAILLFAQPIIATKTFQILNVFIVIFSFLSFSWNFRMSAYPFALVPFVYMFLCFLPKIPRLWQYLTLASCGMVLLSFENGSGKIKIAMALGTLFLFLLPRTLTKIGVRIGHWVLYAIPAVLLYLGLTGQYNIFNGKTEDSSDDKVVVNGVQADDEVVYHVDTRTFLYEETIASAFLFDYIFAGRTPARGYYSPSFAKDAVPTEGIDIAERHVCEAAHLNTFTWLGLIGVILLTCVFVQGTCLAVYSSNNIYVKCIALQVAFHWAYSWVENTSLFMLVDLMIYIMLAFCYSPYFRQMSDFEFEQWFKALFAKIGSFDSYQKYILVKTYLEYKKDQASKEQENTSAKN